MCLFFWLSNLSCYVIKKFYIAISLFHFGGFHVLKSFDIMSIGVVSKIVIIVKSCLLSIFSKEKSWLVYFREIDILGYMVWSIEFIIFLSSNWYSSLYWMFTIQTICWKKKLQKNINCNNFYREQGLDIQSWYKLGEETFSPTHYKEDKKSPKYRCLYGKTVWPSSIIFSSI